MMGIKEMTSPILAISLSPHPLLFSTGLPSLHGHPEQESSLPPPSSRNRMARCAVLQDTRFMQKHAALSMTARYACSMQRGCPIVVGVNCESTV
jgi:hypothetical protein